MIRSSLFTAASVFVLAACQPAAETSEETLIAETLPVVEESTDVAASTADTEDAAAAVEVAATDADADEHDHAEDDHDGDEHDHDEHDHEEDHDGHDHDDDHADDHADHDHEDHDHAGGEAHVHGLTDMAVAIDGSSVSISLDGALANFDLDESIRTLDDTTPYTDGIVSLVGGDCVQDGAIATIRPIGDHGNLMVDVTYTCAAIGSLEAIDVNAFEQFSGFEEVNAVILNETDQSAATLTGSSARIDLR